MQAYADAENQPDTENISQIKKEIEDSLDMINAACEKIFDEMFTDDAWDISSDINVMKRMMEQDGLVDDMKEMKNGTFVFQTEDPNMTISVSSLPMQGSNKLFLKLKLSPLAKEIAADTAESAKKNILERFHH